MDNILAQGAQGFGYTGDQDRYDECEEAISQVLREVRRLAQKLKVRFSLQDFRDRFTQTLLQGILTKSKYYTAIGLVTDAALSRILQDVLALPDIPEVESRKLSELCRILNALEGLFMEDPDLNQVGVPCAMFESLVC